MIERVIYFWRKLAWPSLSRPEIPGAATVAAVWSVPLHLCPCQCQRSNGIAPVQSQIMAADRRKQSDQSAAIWRGRWGTHMGHGCGCVMCKATTNMVNFWTEDSVVYVKSQWPVTDQLSCYCGCTREVCVSGIFGLDWALQRQKMFYCILHIILQPPQYYHHHTQFYI